MPTLQKFKLLATQCATARSPSRSPTTTAAASVTSQSFHLGRRKILKKLLSRSSSRRRDPSVKEPADLGEKKGLLSHSLKDLFVSSPPGDGGVPASAGGAAYRPEIGGGVGRRFGFGSRRGGGFRFGSAGLRYRLLRRSWRPVLVSIPE